jgi:membrane-bound ClpP family serine protease
MVEGAWWNVRSRGDRLRKGATVRVVDTEGLDLVVDRVEPPEREPARKRRERGEP